MGAGHVRVTTEYGTATVWLDFPGEPANALDRARLAELDAALAAVAADPFVNIVVLRSARPSEFCSGLRPEALASLAHPADRAAFAAFGQAVTDRLARLPQTTIAFLDGPVLGAGLELALACDHRLVLSRVTTHLGFAGAAPCLGGTARLGRLVGRRTAANLLATGRTLSGREAVRAGLADHAFCERRGRIELRTFLDTLERRGPRARERVELAGLAAERRAFAAATPAFVTRPAIRPTVNPVPPVPDVIGLLSDDATAARLAAEVALRGGRVVVGGKRGEVTAGIAAALARGFVTPLEADQALARVTAGTDFARAGLVLTDGHVPQVGRRCVVGVLGRYSLPLIREAGKFPSSSPPFPLREGGPGGLGCHVYASGHANVTTPPPAPPPEGEGCSILVSSGLVAEARTGAGKLRGSSPPFPLGEGGPGGGGSEAPRRLVALSFNPTATLFPFPDTDPDAVATLTAWLGAFGHHPHVVALPRPAATRARRATAIPA
ncbi:MAG TPA: enoyl-CoA hydratase/isomerase family protein [Urbifossiella sp.]|jgi:enoyl-CoA hydratase/carnithine racemase|nr:enoyl-CoA hydratase/isomerase family protein [Urbifossiella sp.]